MQGDAGFQKPTSESQTDNEKQVVWKKCFESDVSKFFLFDPYPCRILIAKSRKWFRDALKSVWLDATR